MLNDRPLNVFEAEAGEADRFPPAFCFPPPAFLCILSRGLLKNACYGARQCAPRGPGVGLWGPTRASVGFGAKPRQGRRVTRTGETARPGAHMRSPRPRSGALGSPRSGRVGFGAAAPSRKAGRANRRDGPPGRAQARPVAAEWGLGVPAERPRGVRGEAPSRY